MTEGDGKDSDLELVECWLKGGIEREDAEREIFRRFGPPLESFFQRKHYRPEEVEDLKQKTLQRVLEKIETFKGTGRFSSWVLSIARNVHASNARHEMRESRIEEVSVDALSSDFPTTEPSTERKLISRENLEQVKGAMEQLSKQERRCLELRVQDYSYEEIARILGIEEPTCRTHIHKARKRLRKILRDFFRNDGF